LRYFYTYQENSKLKDSDGLLLGDVSIKNSNKLKLERTKETKSSESKEPLRVLLLMISKK